MCFGVCDSCGVGADLEYIRDSWICENCEDSFREALCEDDEDFYCDERPDENQSTAQEGGM